MSCRARKFMIETIAVLLTIIIFWVPLYYVVINAMKSAKAASLLSISWPNTFHVISNFKTVLTDNHYMILRALYNSILLTVFSISILVVVASMSGFVMQRRKDKATPWINFISLTGLILPPSIVPTIWVLKSIGLFKSLTGLVLVEVALGFPFAVLLYRGFMAGIPREIDEAAIIDGYGGYGLFFKIIFPILKPVTSTIIVVQSVFVFNDFTNPLYFYPGPTVQLTLYNFMSQFVTQYNLLFMDILLITIPPLILFIFFNKKIVAGMTAGSIKG